MTLETDARDRIKLIRKLVQFLGTSVVKLGYR